MIKLSASLIKDILSCNKRGYYRISHPEQAVATHEMVLGNIVHKVIEKEWNTSFSDGMKLAMDLMKENNFQDNDTIYVSRLLKNFYRNFQFLLKEDDDIEKFFSYSYKDYTMVGKMDRVTKSGIIYDWKTGKKEPINLQGDIQFIMYHLAYENIYKTPFSDIYLVNLGSGKMFEYVPNKAYIDIFLNEVIPCVVKVIQNGIFIRDGLYKNSCSYCQFMSTCFKETFYD